MKHSLEHGGSSLAFILLLFFSGLLLLNGLQQLLTQQRNSVAREVAYLQSYAGAVSALAWGGRLRWQGTHRWQCQQKESEWRACLRVVAKRESVLVAQKLSANDKSPIALWRWGYLEEGRWRAAPHGWLDYCPFREEAQCRLPE